MALSVRFYQRPMLNEFESDKQSRPIHDMRDFIRIEIPGMMANVVDTFVAEHHKRDHPIEWAQYMQEKDAGVTISDHQGTLLSSWPQLNAAQVLEMRHYKFYTVEQIAEASDSQIQSIGMLAGMAPMSLRDKARAYLAHAKGNSDATSAAAQLAKRDEQIESMQMHMDALIRRVEEMSKPKLGRPAKETA